MHDTHQHHDRPHRHHYDAEMLSVEEARERILSYFAPLQTTDTPLLDSLGLTLAEDIVAQLDIPPLANSAMDGYAVRSADISSATATTPVALPVIGYIAAGHPPEATVSHGTAIRIMTGAPIPKGADAVVPFEDTNESELSRNHKDSIEEIEIRHPAQQWENVRPAGEDIQAGQIALRKGIQLRPGSIGVAASLGRKRLKTIRRPRVAIISTGDELQEPGEEPKLGKIYNSNAYAIAAAVKQYGAEPHIIGIARDTIESLNQLLDKAIDADMVVTSAGVSKGDYDVVKDVLAHRGEIALWSVRMRPAKPLAFGVLNAPDGRKAPHLGLPGNPVSALVAFEQFGRPAIRVMMGKDPLPKPSITATMDDDIHNHDGRRVYARVIVYRSEGGSYRARTTGNQSSGALTSMAIANGLAICPDDLAIVHSGDTVKVEMLDWPDDEMLSI